MQEPISEFLHHYRSLSLTSVNVLPIYRETALVFDQTKAHVCLLFQLRQRLSERFVITLECITSGFIGISVTKSNSIILPVQFLQTGHGPDIKETKPITHMAEVFIEFMFIPENTFIETKYKRKSHGDQLKQSFREEHLCLSKHLKCIKPLLLNLSGREFEQIYRTTHELRLSLCLAPLRLPLEEERSYQDSYSSYCYREEQPFVRNTIVSSPPAVSISLCCSWDPSTHQNPFHDMSFNPKG